MTLLERLERHFEPEPTSGCFIWTGARSLRGYGTIVVDDRSRRAHRLMYELLRGPITPPLVLDHLCRNTSCVNPAHLEAVSQHQNILRGFGWGAQNARKTHCPQGHPYDDDNTLRSGPGRYCRECYRAADQRKRALALAGERRPCLCGCGTMVPVCYRPGQPNQGWAKGHHMRLFWVKWRAEKKHGTPDRS